MIKDLLEGKTSQEKSRIKSEEISKLNHVGKFTKDNLEVEILSLEKIEVNGQSGVQIFAKAWKDGKQLGFGDGTVEIERFRIFNPPIMVDDPNGDIIIEYREPSSISKDGVVKQRILKEYPIQSTRNTLIDIIRATSKEGSKIIKGTIGNTTSTFFTSADGEVFRSGTNLTWADIHDGAGTVTGTTENASEVFTQTGSTTDRYNSIVRKIWSFDTSAIPDTDVISSALIQVYKRTSDNQYVSTSNFATNIYDATPASPTAIANADYGQLGTTPFSSNITLATWNALSVSDLVQNGTDNGYILNASGIANINKTGYSSFGSREVTYDAANSAVPWEASKYVVFSSWGTAHAGTDQDPKLVVVHAAPVTTVPSRLLSMHVG